MVSWKWGSVTITAVLLASCTKAASKSLVSEGTTEATPPPPFDGPEIAPEPKPAMGPATKTKPVSQKLVTPLTREDEIWTAVTDRISTQVDIWFESGEFPRAIQLLEFQTRVEPTSYDIATNLGWMYENVEDNDTAIGVYHRFGDANPQDPDNRMPEAEIYFRTKKYAEVVRILAPVIDRPKLHPNNYRMLSASYERLKQYDKAESVLVKYLKLSPKDGQSIKNLERIRSKKKGKE